MDDNSSKLFAALTAEFHRWNSKRNGQAQRDILEFGLAQANELGQTICSNLSAGGFCTFVVPGRNSWNPLSFYYSVVREAAKAGKKIHRAFLLPMRSARHNASLKEHVRLDQEAGIQVSILDIGRLISTTAVPFAENLEIGIWDDEIVCLTDTTEIDSKIIQAGWRISRRPEDLQAGVQLRDLLLTRAVRVQPDEELGLLDLEEPMLTTAEIAAELAPVLCRGNHVSSDDCGWYHAVWQYLRIFDMVSTPTWHSQFYMKALTETAHAKKSKILISGTADYSTLAHVIHAYKRVGTRPQITVVDLCETPLLLCRWYSRFSGNEIEVDRQDIFELSPNSSFDIIATDAFLTRFFPEQQPALVNKWFDLLVPGGSVVTTVRIEAGKSGVVARASAEQVLAFRGRALREARKWRGALDRSPEEISMMAASYAEQMISYSIGSESDLAQMFRAAGFDVTIEMAEVPGEMASTIYARVIATKPTTAP